jgi:uroporphyrinogen decarboxylase
MTGKQIVLDLLNNKSTNERIPWVPFAGVHAGILKGYNATEVLSDADKLFESVLEANKLYKPDGQPVVFDLQIEAELLGCELQWEEFSPPSVRTHPLAETDQIPCLCKIPTSDQGRIPLVIDVMKRMKKEVGEETALFGLITGPFTLASHLRGSNIFMDMYDDEDYVKALLKFCVEVNKVFAEFYVEAGMDIIGVVDPLVSQISPTHFEDFLSEPFSEVFDYIKQLGVNSSFFVCGNASNNIDVMCQTKPDSIFVDENVDLVTAKKITDTYNVVIGGNIPLTSIMLHGTQQDNMKYTIDLIDSLTHDNLMIAPGCDMPYHIPAENAIAIAQAVLQTEEVREMIKNYEATDDNIEVDLPDYDNLDKPLVEVFTLDSATCAACTYMMAAADEASKKYGDEITVVEYKYTIKENIARCKKMGVSNLPSIYINGQLKHSSIIPSRAILFSEIDAAKEEIK